MGRRRSFFAPLGFAEFTDPILPTIEDPHEEITEGGYKVTRGHKPIANFGDEVFLRASADYYDLDNQMKAGVVPTEVAPIRPNTMDTLAIAQTAAGSALGVVMASKQNEKEENDLRNVPNE